jgi:hypothetical protein
MRALSASNTSICTSIKLMVVVAVVNSQARRANSPVYLYTGSCGDGDGAEQTCKKWHRKKTILFGSQTRSLRKQINLLITVLIPKKNPGKTEREPTEPKQTTQSTPSVSLVELVRVPKAFRTRSIQVRKPPGSCRQPFYRRWRSLHRRWWPLHGGRRSLHGSRLPFDVPFVLGARAARRLFHLWWGRRRMQRDPERLALPGRPLEHRQRVCLGGEHPAVERDCLLVPGVVREQQVEVLEPAARRQPRLP